jgi:hypothetical protein
MIRIPLGNWCDLARIMLNGWNLDLIKEESPSCWRPLFTSLGGNSDI